MASLIYLDNSNLLISAIQHKKRVLGVDYIPHGLVYTRLLNLLSFNEPHVVAKAYISERYSADGLEIDWKSKLISSGWEVIQKPRCKDSNQEKMIDTQITTDLIFDCLEVMNPETDQVILVAGDRDYVPAVRALRERNIPVYVAFWELGLSELLSDEAALVFNLSGSMDNLFRPRKKKTPAQVKFTNKVRNMQKKRRRNKRAALELARMSDVE